jgi:hypothetical protein
MPLSFSFQLKRVVLRLLLLRVTALRVKSKVRLVSMLVS